MSSSFNDSDQIVCPNCQALISVVSGYTNWCDRCNWNVKPPEEKFRTTLSDRLNRRFGAAFEHHLFNRLVRDRELVYKRKSLFRILAYILATFVHSIAPIFFLLGIFFLVNFWPHVFFLLLGILSLAIAWVTFPRLGKSPEDILDRHEYPMLYGVVERIAADLGLKGVDGITIDHDFNASFSRVGWRGRNFFQIGLPLFSILSTEEKVAILGHEVAHGVNGDGQHVVIVHTAIESLMHWYTLLMPKSLFSSESGVAGILMFPVNLVMVGGASLVLLGAYSLSLLLYQDSQRAEYLADFLATKVAGTDAMVSALEKLYYSEFYPLATQRITLNKEKNIVEELQSIVREMPEREIERLRRVARLDGSRLEASHPPTPMRIEFIGHHGLSAPTIVLGSDEEASLEAEFRLVLPKVQARLRDEYRNYLYD